MEVRICTCVHIHRKENISLFFTFFANHPSLNRNQRLSKIKLWSPGQLIFELNLGSNMYILIRAHR